MKKRFFVSLAVGAAAGIVNGLLGGGGGMVVVPLLIYALCFEEKEAHATAIAVVLPITVVASIVYLINTPYDFFTGLAITVGVSVGGAIGALALGKAENATVRYIFTAVMLATGIKLLFF
mgnify:CR=1 FL=1